MSYNVSYFLTTLSDGFDSWNTTTRVDYYNDYLYGFSLLSNATQWFIGETFSKEELLKTWDVAQNTSLTEQLRNEGYDSSQIFFEYLTNPKMQEGTTDVTIDFCQDLEYWDNFIVNVMLLPAIVVIVILTFLKTRRSLCKNCCGGRPHLLYPISFLDETTHRWAYAAVFALIAYKVLRLFDGEYFWQPPIFQDEEWMKTYGWTKSFVGMANVAHMCVVYYPFLACLSLRRMLTANVLGLLYLTPWLWYSIDIWRICPAWGSHRHLTGGKYDAILQLLFDIPVFLSYIALIVAYVVNLGHCCYKIYLKRKQYKQQCESGILLQQEQPKVRSEPLEVQYLRELLRKRPEKSPTSLREKIKHKAKYSSVKGFKYSPRVVCTMVVSALGIFKFATLFSGFVETTYLSTVDLVEAATPLLGKNVTDTYGRDFLKDHVVVARWCLHLGIWLSFVLHILFMIHMIIVYRRNLREFFKGNHSWHHAYVETTSPVNIMVASLKYSGYQMAFLLFGFLIMALVLSIFLGVFGMLIALPIKYRYLGPLISFIKDYWPTVVVSLLIYFAQVLISKFFLLQGRGQFLALNNRRFYHVVSFFFFFFNILLGFFSCVRRILLSVVFGTLMLSRLDRCLLMRGFEQFDHGFKSYLGMLTVELYHNHPVAKSFVYVLWKLLDDKRKTEEKQDPCVQVENSNGHVNAEDTDTEKVQLTVAPRSKKWKNKWFKAVTMYHNPTVRLDLMKAELKELNEKKAARDAVIDRTADIAAGLLGGGLISIRL